ncbi:zinc-binding dehydrogenase [Arthrobacter sp. B6]|uniref:zinc-binding dehydrogenase n=1 Tax=Arthrobacter sp. B6 TaxID=1570137 RepID=UPI000AAC9FE8|nr:zinc-binding dehydrogenase [Arthrobacter sp. B6]
MSEPMRGYAMLRIGEVGWIDKPKPTPGPRDALLKPLVVAPCTTDVKTVWKGALGERTDMILGHEAVAEVVEVGNLVNDFSVGDVVVVSAVTPEWSSLEAQAGHSSHSGGMLNGWKYSNTSDGVLSEFFLCNDADGNLARVPEGVSYEEATMLSDMIPPGFQAVEYADVQFGDTVLVVGSGPVGLMATAAAYLRGASRVIAVGNRPATLDVAKQYGATDLIDYKQGPIDEQVMDLTGGRGVDRVCVCGGDGDTFAAAVRALKPGGKLGSVIALAGADVVKVPSDGWGFGMGDKHIVGGAMVGGRYRTEKLASLLATGRLDVSPLITHRYQGWDSIAGCLETARNKPADMIKSVVKLT